ncbi:ABC transporter ATP-binding protein [Comamonas sp. CMM03]|uniref:ABC transporter ATP-binding protein n=1 Tax=Comamonas sp. CMM03 TaxID=2854781 RepID=UPI001C4834E7|nr:ABC transporter ATP-binding protein [Comamonas sp. CMM03]MBV7419993.1 ABC transporter ATP-binding protein [Comamonas sp. CMM03]
MSLPSASTPPANVQVVDLAKRYGTGADAATVFEQVNLEVAAGEFVAIVGDSGVGKSTLLNCLAGLDRWDQGQVLHQGQDIGRLDEAGLAVWRRAHVGFVFQAFHVLPHLSVAQNVALPLMLLARGTPAEQDARVQAMLEAVGLGEMGQRLPQQLSGGQLQRVAIARALVHRPALLLADEPTGNLDPDTAARTMDLLVAQTREAGASLVLVTHSPDAAARADRVLRLTARGIAAA